jgi:hypothetical protein
MSVIIASITKQISSNTSLKHAAAEQATHTQLRGRNKMIQTLKSESAFGIDTD